MPKKEIILLLQMYFGVPEAAGVTLTDEQWLAVLNEAKRQSLLGILNNVIGRLPLEQCPPHKVRMRAAILAETIAAKNSQLDRNSAQICLQMRELGLECCILKGQGFARLYPNPQDRTPGDIDLWVKGEMKDTLAALRRRWKVSDVFYHHAEIRPFDEKTEVEVHFRPSWMNNPLTNRKLQRFFDERAEKRLAGETCSAGFPVPDIGFNCVFCAVHIYRHLLMEGVGLRQVMDFYYILRNSTLQDRDDAAGVLSDLGMTKFTRALIFVLKECFMLDEEFFIMPPDDKYGQFLMKEILLAGNFGQYDRRNGSIGSRNFVRRAAKKMTRLSRFLAIAPSEVLWAPVFKTWQHIWKLRIPNTGE